MTTIEATNAYDTLATSAGNPALGVTRSTIVLAMGDNALRRACDAYLCATGQITYALHRPLELLDLRARLVCDLVCVDATQLGLDTLVVVRGGLAGPLPVVGIGVDALGIATTIDLPLRPSALTNVVAALDALPAPTTAASVATADSAALTFDPLRRTVSIAGRSISLTRTEYRLLEHLQSQPGRDVTLEELLSGVWGTSEGIGTAALIRSHVRNLRLKLSQLGAGDVIRVRRGRGYAYVGY